MFQLADPDAVGSSLFLKLCQKTHPVVVEKMLLFFRKVNEANKTTKIVDTTKIGLRTALVKPGRVVVNHYL